MTTLPLNPIQREAQAAARRALLDGKRRFVISLATGAGKTRMAATLALELASGGRVLWLCHQRRLAEQALATFQQIMPRAQLGYVQGEHNEARRRVIVALEPTLRRDARRAALLRAGDFAVIVVDEAHHAVAHQYATTIAACRQPQGIVLGITATPYRSDGQSLAQIFPDGIVYARGLLELMVEHDPATQRPYLCDLLPPVRVHLPDLDLSQVRREHGELNARDLERAIRASRIRHQATVTTWRQHARRADGTMRPTLLYAADITDANAFVEAFRGHSVPATALFGFSAEEEEQRILGAPQAQQIGAFERGDYDVLCSVGKFLEGADFPFVECLIIARHVVFPGLYEQMLGRGARWSPGKTNCLILDVVDNDVTIMTLDEFTGTREPLTHYPSIRAALEAERRAAPDQAWQHYIDTRRGYQIELSRHDPFALPTPAGQWLDQDGTLRFIAHGGEEYYIESLGGDLGIPYRRAAQRDSALPRGEIHAPMGLRQARAIIEHDAHRRATARATLYTEQRATQPITEETLRLAATLKLRMINARWEDQRARQVIQYFYQHAKTFWSLYTSDTRHTAFYAAVDAEIARQRALSQRTG